MKNLKYKLASPVFMWALVIVGGTALWYVTPYGRLFYSGMLGAFVLVLGGINWLYVLYKSVSVHKKAPENVDNIDKLVTEGVYAVVRHPIYAADISMFWCVFIFLPIYQMLALAAWATLVFVFWAKFEERMLEEKFMDDYREYKKRVPMLIPRLFKNF